jgi:hypothetical protein
LALAMPAALARSFLQSCVTTQECFIALPAMRIIERGLTSL